MDDFPAGLFDAPARGRAPIKAESRYSRPLVEPFDALRWQPARRISHHTAARSTSLRICGRRAGSSKTNSAFASALAPQPHNSKRALSMKGIKMDWAADVSRRVENRRRTPVRPL